MDWSLGCGRASPSWEHGRHIVVPRGGTRFTVLCDKKGQGPQPSCWPLEVLYRPLPDVSSKGGRGMELCRNAGCLYGIIPLSLRFIATNSGKHRTSAIALKKKGTSWPLCPLHLPWMTHGKAGRGNSPSESQMFLGASPTEGGPFIAFFAFMNQDKEWILRALISQGVRKTGISPI